MDNPGNSDIEKGKGYALKLNIYSVKFRAKRADFMQKYDIIFQKEGGYGLFTPL